MAISDHEIKRLSALALIALLVYLSFLVLRPILLSIIAGLLLAYVFLPVYKKIYQLFREPNTSALAVSVLIVLIIFIPLWFLVPLVIQQIFDMFNFIQTVNVGTFIRAIIPTSSPQLQVDITNAIINFIGGVTSSSLSSLAGFIINLPAVLLNAAVVIFVFFFTLRDSEKLKDYVSGLSPLRREKEKELARQFKDITYSIIFGYIIVGIIQGIATGIGLLVFGVPRALFLTLLAIFASIIPIVGPWLIWVPAAAYLFTSGSTGMAIGFTLYSVLFVSTIDNLLRPYIVARKTKSSSVVVLVGMIGGLFVFGIIGLILGPLIISYLLLFLEAYRNKTLSLMFSE